MERAQPDRGSWTFATTAIDFAGTEGAARPGVLAWAGTPARWGAKDQCALKERFRNGASDLTKAEVLS